MEHRSDEGPAVRKTVLLASAPEDVWRAVTDEDELAAWFGGPVSLDARPGGTGRFDEPGGPARTAVVEEVDEGRRLVWSWRPEGAGEGGEATRVVFTVEAGAGGTILTVVETPVAVGPVASAQTGGALRSARAEAWARRLLTLELGCLVLAGV